MGRIDLRKGIDLRNVKFSSTSASGHTDGMLYKATISQKGTLYFLKLGQFNINSGFYGIEPIIELVNSRIGEILRLPVLRYSLYKQAVNIENASYITIVQASKDYQTYRGTNGKQVRYNRVSVEKMFQQWKTVENAQQPTQMIDSIGLRKTIYEQFVFDYIICNMDRHGKNTEILINEENPSDIKMAPFFDNSFTILLQRYSSGYKDAFKFNDRMPVNNFIGSNNLLDNVLSIDSPVIIRKPRKEDRQELFQGLQTVTSRRFRDYTWEMLNSRVESLMQLNNKNIVFV